MIHINYIDQIFYHSERGTLAQQSIHSGDRALFQILVNEFGANLLLPVPFANGKFSHSKLAPYHQMNMYAYLAYSPMRDLWFA
jgi:hypothetical protein